MFLLKINLFNFGNFRKGKDLVSYFSEQKSNLKLLIP